MDSRTADLHLHTCYSDGVESPQRIVELAQQAGLSAIAITDHDNTDSRAIAEPVARQLGIELVPGIEMSASADGQEVHLLGFFIEFSHPAMVAHLAEQQMRRVKRVHEMVRRLMTVGVRITAEEVLALAGLGTVGRPHVARILLKHGYISSLPEAFSKYIGPNNPGFVSGSPMPPSRVIHLIRDAGGVPVLAHPVYLKGDGYIEAFTREGLAGLEVYHSSHTPEQARHYEAVADRLKLLKTGGSDFHGDSKEGLPVGASRVPYECVESLRQWAAARTR